MPTFVLYALALLASGAGFVTQSLVSGFWSVTYGNDILHFSVNTACFFLSCGAGTLLSTRWKNPSPRLLLGFTLLMGLGAALSISFLKLGIRYFESPAQLPLFAVAVTGLLCGQIVALTLRLRHQESTPTFWFLASMSAILFSLLFLFVLLGPLGYGKTSLWLGYSCMVIGAALMLLGRHCTPILGLTLVAALLIPYPVHQKVTRFYSAPKLRVGAPDLATLVFKEQSRHQKIVLTEERGENPFFPGIPQHVLYHNGFVQFSSMSEQTSHACLANVPVAAAEFAGHPIRTALILGGGEGLVARNLLGLPKLKKITQVEVDPALIKLAQNELKVRMYNLDSLRNPKVEIVIHDLFDWVTRATGPYDLIIIDIPAPRNISLSRLFTAEFYREVFRIAHPRGMIAIQSGPAFAAKDSAHAMLSKMPSCLKKTLTSLGQPSYVYVSARESEAFLLAPADPRYDAVGFFKKAGMTGDKDGSQLCFHNPKWSEPLVEINRLTTHPISSYVTEWYRNAGTPRYNGDHAVFLVD